VSIGPLEIVLLVVIVLLLFGASRVPSVGRQLGRGARQARKELKDVKAAMTLEDEKAEDGDDEKKESKPLPKTPAQAVKRLLD
jgi:sec-independent protein translocase protein TatA